MSKHDKLFMATADLWKEASTCAKLHVGAVIVDKFDRILSVGYNGTVSGQKHCNEFFRIKDNKYQISGLAQVSFQFINKDRSNWYNVTKDTWLEKHHEFAEVNEVHAEQNALYNLTKTNCNLSDDLSIYVTTEPCMNCAKMIAALNIKHVIYKERYVRGSSVEYLRKCGIEVRQIDL